MVNFFHRGKEVFVRQSLRKMARRLASASAEKLMEGATQRLLEIFQLAARSVPAYQRILAREGISPGSITSLKGFREQVPILDKQGWFAHDLRDICVNGSLAEVASIHSSSGSSGAFSFGLESRKQRAQAALMLDFELQQLFGALDRKTLLINCLPMGVRVHTRSIALTETSVREDVLLALIRKLSKDFEQFILLGEHTFLKHVIEMGVQTSPQIDWKALRIHVITGAEYVSESFRSYLASLLGIDIADPNSGLFIVNYGLSELSVSIAHENWHTIQIRRLARTDDHFRKLLCGFDVPYSPVVAQYYPTQVYLETLQAGPTMEELVVTLLSPDRPLPMIRYNTGDRAKLMSHAALSDVLSECGRRDLIPPVRLPIVLLWGKSVALNFDAGTVYPEQIKEALYADFTLASKITGNFFLRKQGMLPTLSVQMCEGVQPSQELTAAISVQIHKLVSQSVNMSMLAYADYPLGIRHDFERKNRYLLPEEEHPLANVTASKLSPSLGVPPA